jgi:hypothetical protein
VGDEEQRFDIEIVEGVWIGVRKKGDSGSSNQGTTPALDVIFDRVISKLEADEFDYPNDVVFLPADHPDFGAMIGSRLQEDRPIVVVYAGGAGATDSSASPFWHSA